MILFNDIFWLLGCYVSYHVDVIDYNGLNVFPTRIIASYGVLCYVFYLFPLMIGDSVSGCRKHRTPSCVYVTG